MITPNNVLLVVLFAICMILLSTWSIESYRKRKVKKRKHLKVVK